MIHNDEVEKIKAQISSLKARWPAHSVSPALMEELDELEEALEKAIAAAQNEPDQLEP